MKREKVAAEADRLNGGVLAKVDYERYWNKGREFEVKSLRAFLRAGGELVLLQPKDVAGETVDAVVRFGGKLYAYEARGGYYLADDLSKKWTGLKKIEGTLGLPGPIEGMIHAAGKKPPDIKGIEEEFFKRTGAFLHVKVIVRLG